MYPGDKLKEREIPYFPAIGAGNLNDIDRTPPKLEKHLDAAHASTQRVQFT
jgi:hypothetical protein